ncbi:ERF family protein [Burkholderia cenocepacia]|uniref:Single-stranded DNA-binding protein n=3 Tax=Burkholderia cenocepacia TaxID=95486 RepID=A0A1V2W3F1_9BURK|nr:ERF family protein [Burkholderia cenocepacia]MBR8248647.1 ERF family protein [Burkholderia cenocepacia]MBR8288821.1 ERF family protein [Burkholderia cenocepacia]MBR8497090.1 ERF family protein [Burkholderia cenocepacia]ONJ13664.1 single-stranded DNA-binding protein [Burkholderia cenocepacia]ONJ30232.1 single-stranded DNA-binding protein [Burkholderia cenocepacia]
MQTATMADVTDVELNGTEAAAAPAVAAAAPAVVPQRTAIVSATPADLLRIAIEKDADLDKLERLMELQDRHEAKQAKRAFDAAFAAFKAEAVKIIKGRKVTDGPLKNKRYAELHDVVNAVTPALSKHGLSSAWRLTRDEKDWMEVTCYLRHVDGHEESVSMGGPPDSGGAKNAIQARASTKTYLERYTLKAITGLSEEDDDDDGAGGQQPGGAQGDGSGSSGRNGDGGSRRAPPARQQQAGGEPPAFYPQTKFDANKNTWRDMVKSGRKTPAAMIQFIESKGARLSPEQQNTIDSWSHEND